MAQHHHHHHQHTHHHQQQLQLQQQHLQRERSCTRCQSFHRHHHRQRRKSSGVQYTAATTIMSNTTKAIVTVAPPAGANSRLLTETTTSRSPVSLTNLSLASANSLNNSTQLSDSIISLHPGAGKHCTFALTPITIPPPKNKVSFLSTAKFHSKSHNSSSVSISTSPQTATAQLSCNSAAAASRSSPSTPPTPEIVVKDATPTIDLVSSLHHPKLEMRPSVTSQITTVEDVDEICKFPLDEECVDAVIHYNSHYNSSSSNSSLSLSSAAAVTRDNKVP